MNQSAGRFKPNKFASLYFEAATGRKKKKKKKKRKLFLFLTPAVGTWSDNTYAAMTSSFQYCFLRGRLSTSWFPVQTAICPKCTISPRISIPADQSITVMNPRIWHQDRKYKHLESHGQSSSPSILSDLDLHFSLLIRLPKQYPFLTLTLL